MPDAGGLIETLLVEDNPTDAELCIRTLKKHNLGDRLKWVKDGAEALEFLFHTGPFADSGSNNRPKVVLLDLRMPKVDGLEVLRRVRADPRTRTIPIVVLTSSKEDRDITEAYRLGANAFVSKPVEFGAFAQAVAQLGLFWVGVNTPPS
jgi:two-component system response regulator